MGWKSKVKPKKLKKAWKQVSPSAIKDPVDKLLGVDKVNKKLGLDETFAAITGAGDTPWEPKEGAKAALMKLFGEIPEQEYGGAGAMGNMASNIELMPEMDEGYTGQNMGFGGGQGFGGRAPINNSGAYQGGSQAAQNWLKYRSMNG